LRVPGPKVLKSIGAIRLLQLRDQAAPEDVEPTLDVPELFQDGMQTVLKGIRL